MLLTNPLGVVISYVHEDQAFGSQKYATEEAHPVVRVQAIVRDMRADPETAAVRDLDAEEPLTFVRMAEILGIFPSRKRQFCTDKLKLQPIRRWLRAAYPDGNYARFSGVRRDESLARADRQWIEWDDFYDCDLYNPVFDWPKQMCFDYLRHHDEQINPLYSLGFTRVGCAPCVNFNKDDVLKWATRFPEMIDKVRGWEQQTARTFFAPCVPGMAINWINDVVAWEVRATIVKKLAQPESSHGENPNAEPITEDDAASFSSAVVLSA